MKEIWEKKKVFDADQGHRSHLVDFMHVYLTNQCGLQTMVAEVDYHPPMILCLNGGSVVTLWGQTTEDPNAISTVAGRGGRVSRVETSCRGAQR